ncbi:MAG: electron transport complex subunit RsxE [Clostridia bacterium]|nr:electron transport complex subunit RsxE [Clostridia bacterium]MBQ8268074.1 electron transport complex subunit RsxE [Clostridia bacterium]
MKNNKLSILLRGIILENPVLVLVLGTCPTLAQTTSVIGAVGMGIAATLVLILSNAVISALRNLIPDTVRIPCYIVIIATFVTVVQLLMHAYLPALYEMLGVYLALIVVNCIILGRAEMFARKNGVLDSALDGLGMGLGFLLALFIMATVREVLGAGTFAGIALPFFKTYNIPILNQAPGGFLVFGILIAVMNKIKEKDGGVKRKSFSCEGCPSAAHCKKVSCSEMSEFHAPMAKEENENDA